MGCGQIRFAYILAGQLPCYTIQTANIGSGHNSLSETEKILKPKLDIPKYDININTFDNIKIKYYKKVSQKDEAKS